MIIAMTYINTFVNALLVYNHRHHFLMLDGPAVESLMSYCYI